MIMSLWSPVKGLVLIMLCMVALVACTSEITDLSSPMPGIELPIEQMNRTIRLTPALGMTDIFEQTGLIQLELHNLSEEPIVFPADLGISIFIYQNSQWRVVENAFQYGSGDIRLSIKSEYPSEIIVDLMPIVADGNKSTILRIVVIGKIEETNELVGSYIDISPFK